MTLTKRGIPIYIILSCCPLLHPIAIEATKKLGHPANKCSSSKEQKRNSNYIRWHNSVATRVSNTKQKASGHGVCSQRIEPIKFQAENCAMVSSNASLPSSPACRCNGTTALRFSNSIEAVAAISIPTAVFAVFGNLVVIVTVARTRSLHRPANILLSSLALSDLLVGALVQPTMIVILLSLNAGIGCCVTSVARSLFLFRYLNYFGVNPFVQIAVMSWDRYKAVSSPIIYRSTVKNKKTLRIVATAWLSWLAFYACTRILPSPFSRLPIVLSAGASAMIFIVVTQVATIRAIRRRNAAIDAMNASAERNAFAKEKKMAVTLRWILALNVLSFCPQALYSISVNIIGETTATHKVIFPWVRLMLCLNSCLGPIVYFWRHKNMRSAALQVLACAH